jgi:hypothetical protein
VVPGRPPAPLTDNAPGPEHGTCRSADLFHSSHWSEAPSSEAMAKR